MVLRPRTGISNSESRYQHFTDGVMRKQWTRIFSSAQLLSAMRAARSKRMVFL